MNKEANIKYIDKKGNSIMLVVADTLRKKLYVTEETYIESFNRNSPAANLIREYSTKYKGYKLEVNDKKIVKICRNRIMMCAV